MITYLDLGLFLCLEAVAQSGACGGDHKILIMSESVMAVIETETVGMK